MCGILFYAHYGSTGTVEQQQQQQKYEFVDESTEHRHVHTLCKCTDLINHRGPDGSGFQVGLTKLGLDSAQRYHLGHRRLSLVDPIGGDQPLSTTHPMRVLVESAAALHEDEDDELGQYAKSFPDVQLICNGEIYNHVALREEDARTRQEMDIPPFPYKTGSDSEVLLALYSTSVFFILRQRNALMATSPTKIKMHDISSIFRIQLQRVRGVFAFVVVDPVFQFTFAGRDPQGVIPLYVARGVSFASGEFTATDDDHLCDDPRMCTPYPRRRFWAISSEIKAFLGLTDYASHMGMGLRVSELIKPGQILCLNDQGDDDYILSGIHPFSTHASAYDILWLTAPGAITDWDHACTTVAEMLERAVVRRMMCDVPFGVLLSGGLDSSVVSALAQKHHAFRVESGEVSPAWFPQIHSFSVGMEGSPDLAAAQKVADALGLIHHEIKFTPIDGIAALSDVIYHLETYDVTTIRAGTPMFLMAKAIRRFGPRMVLSGEGADELFGGYLYFHKAPSDDEFHDETVRKLRMLHMYDCKRANKAMMAWGIEARVPFLDVDLVHHVLTKIHPSLLRCGPSANTDDRNVGLAGPTDSHARMEKCLVRAAIQRTFDGLGIPEEVLWRGKEQFSDGVGYQWIDGLKEHAEKNVSDADFAARETLYPHNTPQSKEAFLYRRIWDTYFGDELEHAEELVPGGPTVACSSSAAVQWDETFRSLNDPSGRAVADVHKQYALAGNAAANAAVDAAK